MKERTIRILLSTLIYSPFIIVLVVIVLIINYHSSLIPKNNIVKGVGTIVGYDHGGTSSNSAIVAFTKNGRTYTAATNDYYEVGEKFMVEYEAENPEKNTVRLDKPVFLKYEDTDKAVGIVTSYNPDYFKIITFIYFVDGDKFEQRYEPSEGWKIKYPNLKKGKKFMVRYWSLNPKRSVLLLDEPTILHVD